jgi:hypothetical protein
MSSAISSLSAVSAVGASPRVSERAPASAPTTAGPGNRPREDRFDASGAAPTDEAQTSDEEESTADETKAKSAGGPKGQELTPDERQMVDELQLRDREVRAHEAAHKAAGGAYVGGASYTFQQGPDGRQYAIGGEVPVDLSTSGGSPEAVIAKMAQVRAAALAPGDPSPQDHAVAAAADALAAQARRELQVAAGKEASPDKAQDDSTTDEQSADSQTDPATAPAADEVVGVAAPASQGRINGRALEAYRQAQESQFAQALMSQRT